MSQPDPTNPAAAPELHGLDPGELLARGLNTVHPSGPIYHWTPPTPEELARLLPQYHIESMLGRGGMGAVYRGFQEKLDRPVAIKLLPAELTADEQFVTRFEREAKTLARLQHPGIVSIYDFGHTTDGHLYFVMEFVEGTDLQRILQGPGLEPGQALEIITQICEALHAAHCQGVIHRDIKPANILITKDGRVKLADFGLARPDREDHGKITLSNVALGTPDYMAPEQRQGQTDLRADIYALGVMLYEMLTGQLPRGAWAPPSRRVAVDVRIDEVVLKALQLEPDLRYQQASEMKIDVDKVRSGAAATPPPKPPRRLAWAALIAGFALAAAAAIWLAGKARPFSVAAQPPPALSASLAGAIEDPIANTPALRRFVFPDADDGLSKQAFLPAQADSGLLVRLRCAADLMTEEERAQGYDFNTVWEWVQVPPVGGRGENILRLIMGTPAWQQSESGGHLKTIRLLSGMTIDDELFSAERIDLSNYSFNPSPQGIEYTFRRKKGETNEVFLQFEIIPVSHRELKLKYPALRGPGESAGEVAMWIDDPVPQEKSKAGGKAAGDSEKKDSQKTAAEPPLAPGEPKLKETRIPVNDYGLGKYIYTPTRSDLGFVVRYTASPAFLSKLNPGEKYSEDMVYEWAFKPMKSDDNFIQVMQGHPIWNNAANDEDGERSYMMRLSGGPGLLLEADKFPALHMDVEWSKDVDGHMNGAALKFKRFKNNLMSEGDPGETWLTVEITALPVEEIKVRYPKLNVPNLTSILTIKGQPASEVAKDSAAKPDAGGAKLRETEFPQNEYGLTKSVFSPTDEKLGLVVRWTAANPAFLSEWEREQGHNEKTVFEWVQLPAKGLENNITFMTGEPLWNRKDRDKEGDATYLVQLLAGDRGPFISADRIPWVARRSGGLTDDERGGLYEDRAVVEFVRYKDGRSSEGDPGEVWLKAEIQAVPVDEIYAKYPTMKGTYPPGRKYAQTPGLLFINGKAAPDEAY